jgi:hypothetical protein
VRLLAYYNNILRFRRYNFHNEELSLGSARTTAPAKRRLRDECDDGLEKKGTPCDSEGEAEEDPRVRWGS